MQILCRSWWHTLRRRSAEDEDDDDDEDDEGDEDEEDADDVESDDGDRDCDNDFLRSAESIIVRYIGGLFCAENDVSDDEDAW